MFGTRSFRRRISLYRAQSPLSVTSKSSDLEPTRNYTGRQSVVSRKSEAFSIRSGGGKSPVSESHDGFRRDNKILLHTREYLLLLVEAFLSQAAYAISERNLSSEELIRVHTTRLEEMIRMLYWNGYSTIIGLVIGCLADSYIRHYTLALFTVMLHFAVVCLVIMEETIKELKKDNPYAAIVYDVCTVTPLLIKSSDIVRLLYGLEGMTNHKKSAVFLFVFLQYWVSSYATYGGIIVNLFSALINYTKIRQSIVAFFGCGISLYLFVYFLYPETHEKEQRGLGCRVVGCLILATYYKIFRVKIRGKRGYFDKTEGKCGRITVSKTKEILALYVLLMPTLGVCFFKIMTNDSQFLRLVIIKTKSDKFTETIGLIEMGRTIKISSMLLSYFGLGPLLTLIGLTRRETIKFLVGHLLVLLFMFYVAVAMKYLENPVYLIDTGYVRIFNTREKPIHLIPQDPYFSKHIFAVEPGMANMVSYPATKDCLFPMNVVFNGTKTNLTMFLSVTPEEATGYMAIDPPEVVKIRGPYLPLRVGPPGTNIRSWPRIYVYNTAETLDGSVLNIRDANDGSASKISVTLVGGVMRTVALKPGTYDFSVAQADVEKENVVLEEGGVYGIMIYPTYSTREIEVDAVIPPNTAPSWVCLVMYFVSGLATGLANPILLAMVFNISPHGLPTMSLSFVASLEGLSMWIAYIGFKTWHYFVDSSIMFVYSFGMTLFFFVSTFILLRFNHLYS